MTTLSQIEISFEYRLDGTLVDVDSAKFSDSTGTYGIKRVDTGAVVVADGTNLERVSTGIYRYRFTPVQRGLTYFYYIELVKGGITRRVASVKYDPYPSAIEPSDLLSTVKTSFNRPNLVIGDLEDAIRETLQHMSDEEIMFVDAQTGNCTEDVGYIKTPNEYMGMSSIYLTDMAGQQQPPLVAMQGGFRTYQEAQAGYQVTQMPEFYTYHYDNLWLYRTPSADFPYVLFYYRIHPTYDGTIYYPQRFLPLIAVGVKYYYAMGLANQRYIDLWGPLFRDRLRSVKKSIVYEPSIVGG